jgi:hypothetical protein
MYVCKKFDCAATKFFGFSEPGPDFTENLGALPSWRKF